LDSEAVYRHVHRVNNEWFSQHNPMLTRTRIEHIRAAFAAAPTSVPADGSDATGEDVTATDGDDDDVAATSRINSKTLDDAYSSLFTDAEREHLDFDDFMEDWRAFREENPDFPDDCMTVETALAFLQAFQ
jgi:hypothetical protein